MKAVVLREPGRLEVEDIPVPEIGPDQVLVRVRACGICGSDLRYLHGENPWAQHTLGVEQANPPNMVLGHEVAGEIAEVGDPSLERRIGERVVLLSYQGCGKCYFCCSGKENLCPDTQHLGHGAGWEGLEYNPGGMAEYCPIWAEHALPLPDHISFEEATLIDGLGVAVHAVNGSGIDKGDPLAIYGSGNIGILVLQAAQAMHSAFVICLDRNLRVLETAQAMGADLTLDVSQDDGVERVLRETDNLGVIGVINTVDSAESVIECLKMLRLGGRLVQLAVPLITVELPLRLLAGERSLVVSANNTYSESHQALHLAAEGKVKLAEMVTHTFALEQAEQAFQVAEQKEEYGALKVVLKP